VKHVGVGRQGVVLQRIKVVTDEAKYRKITLQYWK
jgi:hypothetical protein